MGGEVMTLDTFIALMPAIVGVLYSAVAIAYLIKGDIPWAIVWAGYAFANIGLIILGMRQ